MDALTQAQNESIQFADRWIGFWMQAQRQAGTPKQQQQCAAEIKAWSRIRAATLKAYQDMINEALHDLPQDTGGTSSRH